MANVAFSALCSPRLALRRFRDADLPSFCRYRSDPDVARYQDWTGCSVEEGRRFLADQATRDPDVEGSWFPLAIERLDTGELIGDCGLHTLRNPPRQVELGFTLAPEHWDHGYATEAVACLLNYVFTTLGKHRAIAVTDARNAAAARVLERVGMRREGHFLENVWFKGSWGDEYLYALLDREWRESHGARALDSQNP